MGSATLADALASRARSRASRSASNLLSARYSRDHHAGPCAAPAPEPAPDEDEDEVGTAAAAGVIGGGGSGRGRVSERRSNGGSPWCSGCGAARGGCTVGIPLPAPPPLEWLEEDEVVLPAAAEGRERRAARSACASARSEAEIGDQGRRWLLK